MMPSPLGGRRMLAKKLAEKKYCEAGSWRIASENSQARARICAIILVTLERRVRDGRRNIRLIPEDRAILEAQLEWASDMMSMALDNSTTSEHCAESAEMAGRIYYEEYEEREHGQNQD